MLGIYIHIPFCKSKCPYCDFYSMRYDSELTERYISALEKDIKDTGKNVTEKVESVYFGGGTPSVIGGKNIVRILNSVKRAFTLENAEITIECNPSTVDDDFFKTVSSAGVNRISLGMQSANDKERRLLGRTADNIQVRKAIEGARKSGINNISLDMMLGVPEQTMQSLEQSINFIKEVQPEHISAYMLKIEEGTFFYKNQYKLNLPDEDSVCDMYLKFSDEMKNAGYEHYEISNFSKEGKRARHNTKYWRDEEYIGFGPSSYSFYNRKRYHYEGDTEKYITGREVVFDETGGSEFEYVMLALRLSDGLSFEEYREKYGKKPAKAFFDKTDFFEKQGYMKRNEDGVCLTPKGFLISNYIIRALLEVLE